ncbi:hypothetical protein BDZ97DRAFT_1797976 [Flammula alnicola]|nr:hypothetical protein BDZ97DRAFT_1797976 [Flammula alnicola]
MPSFADLKAKAAGAASSGKEKLTNMRDHHTSVPMKKTNWDPYSGAPAPPPPPPRSLVNRNTKPTALPPLLPPPSRTSSSALSSASRNSSVSPAPPLPSRSSSAGTPPPPPPRGQPAAPPPPPPRSSSQHTPPPGPPPSASGGPPPIVRSTRPNIRSHRGAPAAPPESDKVDWANLSPEDKQVFFSWLDEFFANFTPPTSVKTGDPGTLGGSVQLSHAPSPLRAASKPTAWIHSQVGNQSTAFTLSHPPATKYGSAALDLAHYFAPTTRWPTAWYNSTSGPSIPPPLVGNTKLTYTTSWRSVGSNKTVYIGIIFSDLSIFWGTADFKTTNPEDQSTVKRSAVYLPPPGALERQELVDAHETYGETIALFAESFLGSGQYCARGECWDLANEGLKYFAHYDYIPKPVPSISRTHGHLIYEGKASNGGREMVGRWRGGDDRIRRGDIAEWRKVRIGGRGARAGGYSTLGDPDHTSIIVSDCVPSFTPKDGASMSPADLGVIVVVEQSVGQLPARKEYDLSCFEEGEMWIYRPISMDVYLGVPDITAVPPEGLRGLQQL